MRSLLMLLVATAPVSAGQLECQTLKNRDEAISSAVWESYNGVEDATGALKDAVNPILNDPSIPADTVTRLRTAIFGDGLSALEAAIEEGRQSAFATPKDPAYDALLADTCR